MQLDGFDIWAIVTRKIFAVEAHLLLFITNKAVDVCCLIIYKASKFFFSQKCIICIVLNCIEKLSIY